MATTMPAVTFEHLADFASVAGLAVSVIGFVVTIATLVSAKKAVAKLRDVALRTVTIADCSAAITVMGEIARLHRAGAWPQLPDRYAEVRRLVVSVKEYDKQLTAGERTELQGAVTQFAILANKVERVISGVEQARSDQLNKILAEQEDRVQRIMVSVLNKLKA